MATIAVRDLTKRYGAVAAVDGLTFDAPAGAITAFLGPNGAGKTTTMRMLLGLARPTSGTATIDGVAYEELEEPARRVGAVLEATAFHPGRRARDHLRLVADAARLPHAAATVALERVDLGGVARQRVGGFSLGMRQRLMLATALLGDPDVLVLDEPTNGLDPEGVRWLRRLLRVLRDEGRTILVSSHLLAEVAETADRVVVVNHGRLVTQGPLDAVLDGAGDLEEAFLRLTSDGQHRGGAR